MQITEYRTKEILNWLDDKAADHTLLFEEMTLFRDAASLVRQLQAAEQAAWHAGIDAGREQGRGKDHTHPPPSAPVGVESAVRAFWHGYNGAAVGAGGRQQGRTAAGVAAVLSLAQQPTADPRSTHRVWRGDDWQPCYCEATNDHRIGSEQPAAVDEAMVERAWVAFCEDAGAARQGIRAALAAALARPGGSDNDR